MHASGLADPRVDAQFWADWQAFEVAHGNEDTFREMMRIKRSVAASYSQTHFNTGIVEAALAPAAGGACMPGPPLCPVDGIDVLVTKQWAAAQGTLSFYTYELPAWLCSPPEA